MYFINNRWPGGLLTNWTTVKKSIGRLRRLEEMEESGSFDQEARTKKEALELQRELDKLRKNLGGIKEMQSIPEIMFVIDPSKEAIAVKEGRKMGCKIFAVVDSNCNPDFVDFPIPGNDDAIRAISLFLATMADAVIEGTQGIESGAEFTDDDASMDSEDYNSDDVRYKGEYDETGEFIMDDSAKNSDSAPVEETAAAGAEQEEE